MRFCHHILPGLIFLATCLIVGVGARNVMRCSALVFKLPESESSQGQVLFSGYAMRNFDWQNQSFDLPRGTRWELYKKFLFEDTGDGIPFEVTLKSKLVYTGTIVTKLDSDEITGIVIDLSSTKPNDTTIKLEFRPEGGHSDPAQPDLRFDERLLSHLESTSRLKTIR